MLVGKTASKEGKNQTHQEKNSTMKDNDKFLKGNKQKRPVHGRGLDSDDLHAEASGHRAAETGNQRGVAGTGLEVGQGSVSSRSRGGTGRAERGPGEGRAPRCR